MAIRAARHAALLAILMASIPTVVNADDQAVEIVDFAFTPAGATVTAGEVVTWTNAADRSHTVTADDGAFDSGELGAGDPFANVFEIAGTFTYHCSIHPEMLGTVVVVAPTATSTPAGSPEPTPPTGTLPPSFAPPPTPVPSAAARDPGAPTSTPTPDAAPVDAGGPPLPLVVAVIALLAIAALFVIPMPGRKRP